jgi:hypothetical protein
MSDQVLHDERNERELKALLQRLRGTDPQSLDAATPRARDLLPAPEGATRVLFPPPDHSTPYERLPQFDQRGRGGPISEIS